MAVICPFVLHCSHLLNCHDGSVEAVRYDLPGRMGAPPLALNFYVLTFVLGKIPFLHKPMSNIAELFILYNADYFFRKGRKDIFWLNAIALLSIAADFSLHYILSAVLTCPQF